MSEAPGAKLKCDMTAECTRDVAYVDRDGYVYCESHGLQRRQYQPCRKLRPAEVRKLTNGQTIRY